MKQKIKLVILGASDTFFSLKKIRKRKSSFFEIVETEHKVNLPEPDHDTKNADQEYLDNQLIDIIGIDEDILKIGIIYCKLQDDFYLRRISHKIAVLSIYKPLDELTEANISVENFIIKNISVLITIILGIIINIISNIIFSGVMTDERIFWIRK